MTFNAGDTCIQGVTTGNDMARIQSNITNGPEVTTNGVDAELTYDFGELMGGELSAGVNTTYVDKYEVDAFEFGGVTISPKYDAVGYANYDRNPGTISEWRALANINYRHGPINYRYELRYVDGVDDNRGGTFAVNQAGVTVPNNFGLQVDSFTSQNFIVGAELPWDIFASLSIINITDEDPPESRLELSYDPYIGDPLGRTWQILIRKTFSPN